MGTRRIESLGDCMRFGIDLQVKCRCGHEAALPIVPLALHFNRRGWPMHFASVQRRLRCSNCGERPDRVGPDPR